MSGENYQALRSDLGKIGQSYLKNPNSTHDDRQLGLLLHDMKGVHDDAVIRQNPLFRDDLLNARQASRGAMILQDAAGKTSAEDGAPTLAAIRQAVLKGDSSYKKGNWYTGDAFGQDIADAAKLVANKAPNTGLSYGRGAAAAEGINGAASLFGLPHLPPGAALFASQAPAAALYNPMTEELLKRVLSPGAGRMATGRAINGLFGPGAGIAGGLLSSDDGWRQSTPEPLALIPKH